MSLDNNSKKKPIIRFNERKLSGRRNPASQKTGLNDSAKVQTFKPQYGKATQSFDVWFRSNYGE